MICEAASVVVVPFPFTDLPLSKPRPAAVLSGRAFNAADDHTVLAMVTTAAASRWASDHPLADWAAAGLRTPCVVRMKLFTLENRLIAREVGRLAAADWRAVRARVTRALG
ncbi:MAG: type II toxin-antitoxin system PemK/MazF family toxin [Caulobacteraceae bacterium]